MAYFSSSDLNSLGRYLIKASRLRAYHRERNRLFRMYRDLYHKRHWQGEGLDDADYQVVLPIHTITVNTAHAIITGMTPELHVYPSDPSSERDVRRAEEVERWHQGVDQINIREGNDTPLAKAALDQATVGVGVIRELYDFPRSWGKGSTLSRQDRYPIIQQQLDPIQVYWEHGNPPRGRFRLVFYEFEMSCADIEATYGVELVPSTFEKDGAAIYDPDERRVVVDWWEWIGRELYHCIFVEAGRRGAGQGDGNGGYVTAALQGDQFIKPPTKMPEYLVIPYHIFPFHESPSYLPHEWGLPVLYALTDIPHWMEILASRQMRMQEMFADPVILASRGQGSPDNAPIPIDKSPGSVIDLIAGDDVRYLQWQGSGPEIDRLWQKFDEIIHELSFSRTLMAQGSPDATGFRTALDRETSLLKIAKGMENYQMMLERLYESRAYAMGRLSPDTPIPSRVSDRERGRFTVAVTGKRLSEYSDIVVVIRPRFSGDLQQAVAVAAQAVAANVWSVEQAMEHVPPPDGASKSQTRDMIIQDKLEFHPAVVDARAQYLAAQIQAETQKILAQLQQPGPGSPPGAGTPGPQPSTPGLPGTPSAPGQPAGASPESPYSAGLDNRLRAMAGPSGGGLSPGLPPGTVTPENAAFAGGG